MMRRLFLQNTLCVLGVAAGMAVISFVFPLHAQDDSTVLYPSTYQAEDSRITLSDDATIVDAADADGGQAVDMTQLGFDYSGTDILVKWQGDSPIISPDCQIILPQDTPITVDGWRYSRFSPFYVGKENHFSLHTLSHDSNISGENPCLWLTSRTDETLRVDSIMILDRTFERIFPGAAAIAITLGMTLFVVGSALRERWRR